MLKPLVFLRVLHAMAVLTWVGLGGALLCYVLPCVLILRTNPDECWGGWRAHLGWLVAAGWGVVLAVGVLAIWRRLAWRTNLCLLGGSFAVVAWLVTDLAPVTPLPELGALRQADDPGWDIVAWMVKNDPRNRLDDPHELVSLSLAVRLPLERSQWDEHVHAKRREILEAWNWDGVGREWSEKLGAQPPQGLHVVRFDEPTISFARVRASQQVRAAYAYLIAVEGRRDEALHLLAAQIKAWSGLQRQEACLVHQMIAVVMIRDSVKVSDTILDLGAVEPSTLEEVRSALESLPPVPEICRLGFIGDYCYSRSMDDQLEGGLTQEPSDTLIGSTVFSEPSLKMQARILGLRWVLLRHTWQRDYYDAIHTVYRLAAQRDLEGLERFSTDADIKWSIRNAMGTRLVGMALPSFSKVARNIWAADDSRRALLARLEAQAKQDQPELAQSR